MRYIGLDKLARSTWEKGAGISERAKKLYIAYADGINDYVKGVSLTPQEKEAQTARLLPPEFLVFGIT